jgi:hypothetical protein
VALDGELVRLGECSARDLCEAGSNRAKGSRAPLSDTSPFSPTCHVSHLLSLLLKASQKLREAARRFPPAPGLFVKARALYEYPRSGARPEECER